MIRALVRIAAVSLLACLWTCAAPAYPADVRDFAGWTATRVRRPSVSSGT